MKYADAKDVANAIKELFQPTQQTGSGRAQEFFNRFGGGGPEGTGQFFESVGLRPGRRRPATGTSG